MANLASYSVTHSLASSRSRMAPTNRYQHQVRGCNAVVWVDRKENDLSAELLQQTSSISQFLPRCGKPHSSNCENGCKNTTYSFPSARTGADHQEINTMLIMFGNTISRAYTAGLATSTTGGSHQRRGNHGQMATAQTLSVWTHV